MMFYRRTTPNTHNPKEWFMKRLILWGFLPPLIIWATSVAWLHYQAVQAEKASQNIKPADIAVILGNAVNRRGKPNPCLRSRVEAGVALYRQNKVSGLLMRTATAATKRQPCNLWR